FIEGGVAAFAGRGGREGISRIAGREAEHIPAKPHLPTAEAPRAPEAPRLPESETPRTRVHFEREPSTQIRPEEGALRRPGGGGRFGTTDTSTRDYEFNYDGKRISLERGQEVTIGRDQTNPSNRIVSGEHARLGRDDNGLYIVDKSTNGT